MLDLIKKRLVNHKPQLLDLDLQEAGVLIAITDEFEPQVVLTKRAIQLSSHGGEIAFPGGKRDDTDTDIVFTALREAQEEIDLNPEQVHVLCSMSDNVSLHKLKVSSCVGVIAADIVLKANPDELECLFKVPLKFFLDSNNRSDHLPQYQAKAKYAPCYVFEGHLIWGLTSYILVDFLNVALEANIHLKIRPEQQGS
ncbi:MAG: CoA pyrophosphatase [Oceanospirillaceae bacterium]